MGQNYRARVSRGDLGSLHIHRSPVRNLLRHHSGAQIFEVASTFLQKLVHPWSDHVLKGRDTNLFDAISSKDQTPKSRVWNYAETETGDIAAQNQTPLPEQLCGLLQQLCVWCWRFFLACKQSLVKVTTGIRFVPGTTNRPRMVLPPPLHESLTFLHVK